MQVMQADRRNVTGSYELMGVNGSVLPATVDDEISKDDDRQLRCRILSGELRLDGDGRYRLALTARYEAAAASYTRLLESVGTWRFLASALDGRSGEVSLMSAHGRATSAAVTPLSLVHSTRVPGASSDGLELTWVYLRRASRSGAGPEPPTD
jgi:hypothetical protein